MKSLYPVSAREQRLIAKGNVLQLGRDLRDFHLRADAPMEAAGSLVMAPLVAITKFGNAIAGEFSSVPAEPLGDGGLKYMMHDVHSAVGNILAAGKNLITLHPLRAAGNIVKAGFDAADLAIDPLLDIGSGVFGHQQRVRNSMQATLAA